MAFLRSNRKLLQGFKDGDLQAMEEVYRVYVPAVSRMVRTGVVLRSGGAIYGLGRHQDCLDLIQETFAKAFSEQARQSYDGIHDYKNYLLTICRNLMVDWARSRGRELPSGQEDLIEELPDETSQEVPYADEKTRSKVREYLTGLSDELADLYRHRYKLCHTQERTAREMGISRQRVRTLEGRLRKGLSRSLSRAGLQI